MRDKISFLLAMSNAQAQVPDLAGGERKSHSSHYEIRFHTNKKCQEIQVTTGFKNRAPRYWRARGADEQSDLAGGSTDGSAAVRVVWQSLGALSPGSPPDPATLFPGVLLKTEETLCFRQNQYSRV